MNKELLLLELIKKNADTKKITLDDSIEKAEFSSYKFVKCVVEIEDAFNVEFDDEYLDFNKFKKIRDILEYINSL